MSSVREVTSWQDAYIFCLQPNFQDDLWLFMIFAAIQVSIAGLKLTSFFINRWARGAKVGSGDEDEENVGDDGASGGISIMGVLTLIAGALILAAYCEDEPDERTFNVFKAGVYLNTFLFAVALIFICGLVVAFVLDIITRRRGRSITFRMFLGGTIVLSIAAAFFGATGIMGLKYVQSDCYDEVNEYFEHGRTNYLGRSINYAEEIVVGDYEKPTEESLYSTYKENLLRTHIFATDDEDISYEPFYVSSIIRKATKSRQAILGMKINVYYYEKISGNADKRRVQLSTTTTEARCFDTAEGFTEVDGLLSCKIRYSKIEKEFAKYEETKKEIVDRDGCTFKEEEIYCNKDSKSFPLCCEQFDDKYTIGQQGDCWCINNVNDASCGFESNHPDECLYTANTLNLDVPAEKKYYCEKHSPDAGYCIVDDKDVNIWDDTCKNDDSDIEYNCCNSAWDSFTRTWYKLGEKQENSMMPSSCKKYENCRTPEQFFGGCCGTNPTCKYCEDKDSASANQNLHANSCGYSHCFASDKTVEEKADCCREVQRVFGFTFEEGHQCEVAINYSPCDDGDSSLACSENINKCSASDDCFPNCCIGLNFDFANSVTIGRSIETDCFQLASELIGAENDVNKLLGQYIYHHTGKKAGRGSCKAIQGIIDPKCCNENYDYDEEDPCYCHGKSSWRCTTVHHSDCLPGNGAYPQCCFDIGAFFGPDHFCTCRQNQDPEEPRNDCNDVSLTTSFDFIETCPNPCIDGKALLTDGTFVCEKPVFEL